MENLTQDEIADRIDALERADWNLREAIKTIADALQGTEHERHANAYIIPHLESWLDNSYNMGILQYQDALRSQPNDEDN